MIMRIGIETSFAHFQSYENSPIFDMTPLFWHEPLFWHDTLFWHERANWCWAIKTHFSFASLFPSIRKVLQNTTDMIKNGSFIKTKKIIQHKNKTKKY